MVGVKWKNVLGVNGRSVVQVDCNMELVELSLIHISEPTRPP